MKVLAIAANAVAGLLPLAWNLRTVRAFADGFKIVCWPRKMSNCHLPGMLSALVSISTLFKT